MEPPITQLFQLALWDEMMRAIAFSKDLSVAYCNSVENKKSDSNELLNAFRTSNEQSHDNLDKFLNSFITSEYADGHNTSLDIETHVQTRVSLENIAHNENHSRSSDRQVLVDPNESVTEKPRYRSRSRSQVQTASSEIELRSDIRFKYPPENEFRSQTRNLNRSLSNYHIPSQSRNANRSPSNFNSLSHYKGRNKSRSKSQDQHDLNNKTGFSQTRRQTLSRHLDSYSPIQTQHERRNRSRSNSYDEHRSRSTFSSKKRSYSRIRRKSRSKSLDREKRETRHRSLTKSKNHSPYRPLKNNKFKGKKPQEHDGYPPQNKTQHPSKNWKKAKCLKPAESTSSSGASQLEEKLPIPVMNCSTSAVLPQNVYQVPRPIYHNPHNSTAMYYPPPTCMPRLIPPPAYYMPQRPRLSYPANYPRFYGSHWHPEVLR